MGHALSNLVINNYKSISAESFDFFAFTPLVGYNNAGKTNILTAIKWLLRGGSLPAESFYNPAASIVMDGTITGITQALLQLLPPGHRASITPFIVNDTLRIRRVQNQPGDTAANIRLSVFDPAAADPANEWRANPAGIDNALKVLFPEPIHIGAMENSEEDVSKSKTTTTIGKLLAEILGPIEVQVGPQVEQALAAVKDLLDADGGARAANLVQFDAEVNQKIGEFFPDVNIRVHVPMPELKEVFTKGTIRVYEQQAPDGRDVSALGHGAQRSIQMALVRHLAEMKQNAQPGITTTLLLIDEPELYLHPQAIEVVRDALKVLSTQGYQVIFSTHSPLMIAHEDVANTILIRKNPAQGTYRRRTLRAAVPLVILDAPSQSELLFSLSNASNILFSESVVLAEGQTEHRVLPTLFEKVTGRTLGLHKVALVKQNGSGSNKKSMSVLGAMDLPTKSVVDLDYAFKHGESHGFLVPNDPDVVACKAHLGAIAAVHGITLEPDGWPRSSPTMSAAQAFAVLANEPAVQGNITNLHTKLQVHNIWMWRKGTIEVHLGLPGKSEAHWSDFVTSLRTQALHDVAPDHQEITDCVNWLTA